ncbi:MAG: ChaN family lipoprotein, partial [Desulfosarcina sp.]|nr:ChaN family lipoprotein [Desulfobacterales bacterium]
MKLPSMMTHPVTRLLTGFFLAGLIWEGCAMAPVKMTIKDTGQQFSVDTILSAQTRTAVSYEDLLDDLEQVRIVYVGETHTNAAHHAIQARLIESLHARHPDLSVGMEMFDHRYDPILAEWPAGQLDRETFIRKTHWYVRRAGWGFDFDRYAPVFETVRYNDIRLVGLNVPGWIPSNMSRSR